MSYSQALPALRACMQLSSPKAPNTACQEEAQAFTIHSLKVGLLSAAKQQRLPEDARRTTGHHKSSAELYGRDDTIDSLWVQATVAQKVAEGWRPSRPIARGGQAPTTEPPFWVPREAAPSSLAFTHLCLASAASSTAETFSSCKPDSSGEEVSPTEAPPAHRPGAASDINRGGPSTWPTLSPKPNGAQPAGS